MNNFKTNKKNFLTYLLIIFFVFNIAFVPLRPVQAQQVVTNPIQLAWDKVQNVFKKLWQKGGSLAFQQTLRIALDKIAYDTADWIGSGGEGQQPLLIAKDWGSYLSQIGDEAAGDFLEHFSQNLAQTSEEDLCNQEYKKCLKNAKDDNEKIKKCNEEHTKCIKKANNSNNSKNDNFHTQVPSFNVCKPSSLNAKLKISLGLAQASRPSSPNCSASQMINNWEDEVDKYKDFKDKDYLDKFSNIFNPRSNDLGIYVGAVTDSGEEAARYKNKTSLELMANKGWRNPVGIAGNLLSLPGQAEREAEKSLEVRQDNFGKATGDAFVDAASIFLNQLALSGYNNLMRHLGEKIVDNRNVSTNLNYGVDPSAFSGKEALQESISFLQKPNFGVRTDYNVLSDLAICMDPTNPRPNHCIIDNSFMQGITEKKTVIEAVKDGYLHGNWQLTQDTQENTYSLRNIKILRKYRILPIGWEILIKKANSGNKTRKVTLMDAISCFDPNDQYNDFSVDFDPQDQVWCEGLVDPNWVLKAPLNYCRKEGVGAQILNTIVMPSVDAGGDSKRKPSYVRLTRVDDYCADNKTCIKEKDDGTCEAYGYCNKEKRIWKFNTDSCQPINNTCQTFISDAGKKVSYLKNTLDYGECNVDNSGCKKYSLQGDYNIDTNIVDWNPYNIIYFNKNVSSCRSKDNSCTELIRVKPNWGFNLVMDSEFDKEEVGDYTTGSQLGEWPVWGSNTSTKKFSIVDVAEELSNESGKALKFEASGSSGTEIAIGTFSNYDHPLIPQDFEIVKGESYSLSADIYIVSGDKVHLILGSDDYNVVSGYTDKNKWKTVSVTRTADNNFNELNFLITGYSSSGSMKFYVKNVKLEVGNWSTNYSSYQYDDTSKIYEKLIPSYLSQSCYKDVISATKDYELKDDAPSICYDYTRLCNKDEVGCKLFTSSNNVFSIPAQVTDSDYCSQECVGYNIYIANQTYFNTPKPENLIPNTATKCNAVDVGCNEFTNLDAISQGGEQKEYYTYLKQCIKPGQAACGAFYSWEGTSNGYQLRVYDLKLDNDNGPAVTSDDSSLCNVQIYSLSPGDPGYNSDCKQYYNKSGEVFYHLASHTITCSENCHAYRLNEKNIDYSLGYSDCIGDDKHWDAINANCYVCLNGGLWDDNHQACVYQAIPGEGKTCHASNKGCREYNGNNGNNVRVLSAYDFEFDLDPWKSNCLDGINWSAISNNKNGHSLAYNSNAINCAVPGGGGGSTAKLPFIKKMFADEDVLAYTDVTNYVSTGNAYTIKFIAKSDSDTDVNIYLYNTETQEKSHFSPITIKAGNEWKMYEVNLDTLDHKVGSEEKLVVTANHSLYIDNFVFKEIFDRYYLISGSSKIPDICYYDIFDNYQGPDYNLGCSAYYDQDDVIHNLHQFSKLCSDSSVGCEQMIDTKNSQDFASTIWGDTNDNGVCDNDELDCIKINRDSVIYVVYDKNKECNKDSKGCILSGQKINEEDNWSDVFVKNDPDQYDKILCSHNDLGCEAWEQTNGDGTVYFKNPGNNTCIYRAGKDTGTEKAWYKIPVKYCDINDDGEIGGGELYKLCKEDSECEEHKCIIDTADRPCSTTYLKTIGLGGEGNQVFIPDQDAALCNASASSCTEYIDPVSKFSINLVYNPNYLKINGNDHDGWNNNKQDISLEKNKLYVLISNSDDSSLVKINFDNPVRVLGNNNELGEETDEIQIPGDNHHVIFDSFNNTIAHIIGGKKNREIIVREVVVSYQLKDQLDKKFCNGKVNFDNGCILFNERTVKGNNDYIDLINSWDAYSSIDSQSPVVCDSDQDGSCTANQLIKVRPDRVCASWYDCLSYGIDPNTGEKTCYTIGSCNRLNDNNECASFIDVNNDNLDFDISTNKDDSGYSIPEEYSLSNMREVGLNSDVHYDFEENIPPLSCLRADNPSQQCSFSNGIKELLVREPEGSPTNYPAHGETYLRVPASYYIYPYSNILPIKLEKDKDYYINYLVNTKNTGLEAKVELRKKVGSGSYEIMSSWKDISNNGWKRVIHTFHTINRDDVVYQIRLGVQDSSAEGEVYFDDINIEPVLKIGDNKYVSRECRLYPDNHSMTCVNKNKNVLEDGLEGYCLEHDKDNPNVCLLWYPVDQISIVSHNISKLGYHGKFPLYYCSMVNGDFSLVKKIIPKKVYSWRDDHKGEDGMINTKDTKCQYLGSAISTDMCGDGENYKAIIYNDKDGDNHEKVFCIPKMDSSNKLLEVGPRHNLNELVDEDDQGVSSCNIPYRNFWAKTDGSLVIDEAPTHNNCDHGGDNCYYDSCSDRPPCERINEANNANPPIRVYDYHDLPSKEDDLKYIYSKDSDKQFNFTCDGFVQTVTENGINKAWARRVSNVSKFLTTTPPYFIDTLDSGDTFYGSSTLSNYNLLAYGRNRSDIPFGAAEWDDDFSLLDSTPVPLQMSSNKDQDVKAGRPYGCDYSGSGLNGCSHIGYCSSNPDLYCIYSEANNNNKYKINEISCGGHGVCIPLWGLNSANDLVFDNINRPYYLEILHNLFLDIYTDYKFNYEHGEYENHSVNFANLLSITKCDDNTRPESTYDDIDDSQESFCAIYPSINNVSLEKVGNSSGTGKGLYELKFNSYIDNEQQPLKQIVIDWKDGTVQVVNGQDEHSALDNPHVFYHYYKIDPSNIGTPIIKITDNWGFFGKYPN